MSPALAEPKLSPEGTETVCTLNGRVLVFSLPLILANLIIVRLYFCKKKKKKKSVVLVHSFLTANEAEHLFLVFVPS